MDCWSCGAERGEAAFCTSCSLIQPVSPRLGYFEALGLEPSMQVDRKALDAAFREVSKKVHPDRFPRDEPEQRKMALAHTEIVNQGYRALKDPLKRAEYLLERRGVSLSGEHDKVEDPMFLMTMLEKQEALEETTDPDAVQSAKAETKARQKKLLALLAGWHDRAEGTDAEARAALIELRYLARMLELVGRKEEELF